MILRLECLWNHSQMARGIREDSWTENELCDLGHTLTLPSTWVSLWRTLNLSDLLLCQGGWITAATQMQHTKHRETPSKSGQLYLRASSSFIIKITKTDENKAWFQSSIPNYRILTPGILRWNFPMLLHFQIFFFFFLKIFFFFWCGPFFFKVFIEFVTILLLFYVLVFWPQGTWDLSSPTRGWTRTPCTGRQNLKHWTTSEVPFLDLYLEETIMIIVLFNIYYLKPWPRHWTKPFICISCHLHHYPMRWEFLAPFCRWEPLGLWKPTQW